MRIPFVRLFGDLLRLQYIFAYRLTYLYHSYLMSYLFLFPSSRFVSVEFIPFIEFIGRLKCRLKEISFFISTSIIVMFVKLWQMVFPPPNWFGEFAFVARNRFFFVAKLRHDFIFRR